jgi:poly-gamma-glutamate capsule biosynthesis protein CapA/YwtB (metallophosphatase superfamily)
MDYTLAATGDIMLQGPIIRPEAAGLDRVLRLLNEADHTFVNLEQALTDRGEPADKLVCLRGHPHLANELARAGVDVATIANNHTMDFGITGMRDTVAALRTAGIAGGEPARALSRASSRRFSALRDSKSLFSASAARSQTALGRGGAGPVLHRCAF